MVIAVAQRMEGPPDGGWELPHCRGVFIPTGADNVI